MPRALKPRSAGEHAVVLSRMLRQVNLDPKLPAKRKATIKRLLLRLLGELNAEAAR